MWCVGKQLHLFSKNSSGRIIMINKKHYRKYGMVFLLIGANEFYKESLAQNVNLIYSLFILPAAKGERADIFACVCILC